MPNRNPDHGDPDHGDCENGRPENGDPDSVNVRSKDYLIARTAGRCTHCGVRTPLVALVLPPSHETRSLAEDDGDGAAPRLLGPRFRGAPSSSTSDFSRTASSSVCTPLPRHTGRP